MAKTFFYYIENSPVKAEFVTLPPIASNFFVSDYTFSSRVTFYLDIPSVDSLD
jgi:hypothetical protein